MSLRKRVKNLETLTANISMTNIAPIICLLNEILELEDRVKALEKGKPCECKKENEDDI